MAVLKTLAHLEVSRYPHGPIRPCMLVIYMDVPRGEQSFPFLPFSIIDTTTYGTQKSKHKIK